MMRAFIALVLVVSFAPGAFGGWKLRTLQGEGFPLEALYEGKWCLAFVVAPGCTACALAIGWLARWQEEQTESGIQVALVVPWETPELRAALGKVRFPVVVDDRFILASWFEIKTAPTVVLFAEGTFQETLEWPFDAEELGNKLAELEAFVIPRPQDILGMPPPELSGVDLGGNEVAIGDLPRPVLLFFFSTTCPACRASLEFMDRFTQLLPVCLVVLTKGHELTEADREELSSLADIYGDGLRVIVLGEREAETMKRYRIRWTPTFFLVDGEGKLRAVWEGPSESLIPELEELVGTNPH